MILNGECDYIPEHHFLYKAGIDEVIASYEKEKKQFFIFDGV